VALNPPVALSAGTYWVAVQAIEGGGTWEWTSGVTQSLHAAAIREAGAHGYNCPDWTSVNDCFHPPPGPDQSFELLGSVVSDAGAPPPADIKPPALTASAPRSESIKSGFVTVTDKTDEAATDTATGTISVSGATKVYRLAKATATHPAGQVRLKLKIPKKALKAIRHALAHHRKAVARVRVGSQDVAGNRANARTLRIKLKR
jgi:hypothetical protein